MRAPGAPALIPALALALLLPLAPVEGAAATAAGADTTAAAADPPAAPPDSLVEVSVLAGEGRERGQVLEPDGVVVDPLGRVWVSDAALHRVQRWDAGGHVAAEVGALGSDPLRMRRPGSLARFGALGVEVLDRENRRILTYDMFDRPLGTLVSFDDDLVVRMIGRVEPTALATDRSGAPLVLDRDGERLVAFDVAGAYLRTIGAPGSAPGSFRGLRAVAVTARGEILTAERGNARVQRLDPGGRPLGGWPLDVKPGSAGLAIAVDDSGRVAVADESGGRLWLWGRDGALLAVLAGLGRPRALAFTPAGDLVVAESLPPRVRRLRLVRAGGGAAGPER